MVSHASLRPMPPGQHTASTLHRMGRAGLLGAAIVTGLPGLLGATPVRITSPTAGCVLRAGELVEVRWQGLPDDVDEMELLLEVDHAAAVRVRLTPQLGGASRGYTWRVPNLPGRCAALRLRWGRDGVETEGEASAPFSILSDPAAPLDGVRFQRGEWWIGGGPSSPVDLPWRGLGRAFQLPSGAPPPATTVNLESLEPSGAGCRHAPPPAATLRSATATCIPVEVSAHRPLTIPLRP